MKSKQKKKMRPNQYIAYSTELAKKEKIYEIFSTQLNFLC